MFRRRSTRHDRLARRLAALALGRVGALLGRLLVTRHGRSLGLLALVPRVAAVAATWWQAGVLGEDLGGGFLGDLVAAGRRRVLATGTLVAVGGRLVQRDQLVFTRPDQVSAAHAGQCFTQHRPAFRVVVAQEGLVQTALLFAL